MDARQMSMYGEQLVIVCEEAGAEDGARAAKFSPPVSHEYDQKAYAAYGTAYWEVLARCRASESREPQTRLVRRARMIAFHKKQRAVRRLTRALTYGCI